MCERERISVRDDTLITIDSVINDLNTRSRNWRLRIVPSVGDVDAFVSLSEKQKQKGGENARSIGAAKRRRANSRTTRLNGLGACCASRAGMTKLKK